MSKIELHIEINEAVKAIDALFDHLSRETSLELSKQQVKTVMSKGAVWLGGCGKKTQRSRRPTKVLQPGQVLHLYYDEKVLEQQVEDPILIVDQEEYSLWYKPYGMLSQGSKWSDHCTITRYAEGYFSPSRNGFLIHRLDRAATGLILVGHGKKVTAKLCEIFRQRQLKKDYLVVVHGHFARQLVIDAPIDGKKALSKAKLKQFDPDLNRSLVEVEIETGRKHQIRRHMAGCGHPVVGDRLYGVAGDNEDLQLTAYRLQFYCPKENRTVEHILPQSLWPKLSI